MAATVSASEYRSIPDSSTLFKCHTQPTFSQFIELFQAAMGEGEEVALEPSEEPMMLFYALEREIYEISSEEYRKHLVTQLGISSCDTKPLRLSKILLNVERVFLSLFSHMPEKNPSPYRHLIPVDFRLKPNGVHPTKWCFRTQVSGLPGLWFQSPVNPAFLSKVQVSAAHSTKRSLKMTTFWMSSSDQSDLFSPTVVTSAMKICLFV